MPFFRKLLQSAQEKLDRVTREQGQRNQYQQDQQYQQQSHFQQQQQPPIPYGSKPLSQNQINSHPSPRITRYWSPDFSPRFPVNQYFYHETGQTGWGNNECQNYTSTTLNSFNVALDTNSTALVVRAIANSQSAAHQEQFTSARLISHQRLGRSQGYFSVRLSAPISRGIWPAVWLLPAQPSTWPSDGEIDVFETWDGDSVNHTCLHWGDYAGQQNDRHRMKETYVPGMTLNETPKGKCYGLAWTQEERPGDDRGRSGRVVWYLDGKAVMKARVPDSTKRLSEWQIIVNVAMGGDVNKGRIPDDGTYDLILHEMGLWEAPPGGWEEFERDFKRAGLGHTM